MIKQRKTFRSFSLATLFLRLALAIVILPHGCQLMFGSFGGLGFDASMDYFMKVERLPVFVGFAVIYLQFFGSLLILAGLGTRMVSVSMIILFIGMIVTNHLEHGFFMNWFGTQKGEGYEYHLLVIGMFMSLAMSGAGKLSLDHLMLNKYVWSKAMA